MDITYSLCTIIFVVEKSLKRMKINHTTLNKVEKILEEGEYIVRYERGTFQSGYCILEAKKVVVLNKFLSVEGRINTLIELLPKININIDLLTHDSQMLYDDIIKKSGASNILETTKPAASAE